jgi:predicted DNA-binding protein (MmcQ/YjbR family)
MVSSKICSRVILSRAKDLLFAICLKLTPMDNERIREICLSLPYAKETVNWGHHLVYWAGDRDLGGKMFAMTDLEGTGTGVLWFHCGTERFHELLEIDGIIPSPYLAKAFWVTLERWDALRPREIEDELRRAHALIFDKLPARTRTRLESPEKPRKKTRTGPKTTAASRPKPGSKRTQNTPAKARKAAAKAPARSPRSVKSRTTVAGKNRTRSGS